MNLLNQIKFVSFLFAIVIATAACQRADNSSKTTDDKNQPDSNVDQYTDAETALLHYWEDFDFTDTAAVMNPEIGEQKLVDFIAAFPNVSDSVRTQAIHNMLAKAEETPASFDYFAGQFEHYLYNPNSPVRNDLYYESVLTFLVDSEKISEAERLGYINLLKLVRKNQVGTEAENFRFLLPDGGNSSLDEIDAPLTILFFYEPGCSFCETSIDQLEESPFVQDMISKKNLDIVAIYPYGDLGIWKGYQERIPVNWINGFDSRNQILERKLYDIRATPTIYLLDKDKKVLLKDTDMELLANFLIKTNHHS